MKNGKKSIYLLAVFEETENLRLSHLYDTCSHPQRAPSLAPITIHSPICDHYIPFERKKRMSIVPCSIFHQVGLWASNSQESPHTIQQCLTLSIKSQIFRLQKPDQRRLQLSLSFAQGSSIPAVRLQRWYNFIMAIKLLFLSINKMICEQEPRVTASTEGRIVIIAPLEECHRQELEFDHESLHPVKHLPWSEYKTPQSSHPQF